MLTRKLGALLRGKATPFQIVAASVLGALLGFAPALRQAPGLYVVLVGTLLVVSANLGLAILVAGGARLLSLVAAPVSFSVGQFLLDGPTSGLARTIVNAPVLAWFGLQYYAVAGGQALALVLGLGLGLGIARLVRGFQRRMAAAAGNPSRLNEIAAKPLARSLVWVFFGGGAKGSWDQVLERRIGNPVRITGVVVALGLGGGLYAAHRWIARTWARDELASRLEVANGATADVGGVELDLREGRLGITGVALADPEELAKDIFRAEELSADFDQVDILRRRVHVAKLVVAGAKSGAPRAEPGRRVERAEPSEPPAPAPDSNEWDLEQVLAQAELWKARLARGKQWLDRLAGARGKAGEEGGEGVAERAARAAREAGWFTVAASHLVDEAPTFRLSELSVAGLVADWLPGKELDLVGRELSTQPWLLDAPAQLELGSRDGSVGFAVDLAPVSRAGGKGALRFHWKGLSVDEALAQVRWKGAAPLSGGTLDLELDGSWADGRIGVLDLPLLVTFRDTTLALGGGEPTKVEKLVIPIGLAGRSIACACASIPSASPRP